MRYTYPLEQFMRAVETATWLYFLFKEAGAELDTKMGVHHKPAILHHTATVGRYEVEIRVDMRVPEVTLFVHRKRNRGLKQRLCVDFNFPIDQDDPELLVVGLDISAHLVNMPRDKARPDDQLVCELWDMATRCRDLVADEDPPTSHQTIIPEMIQKLVERSGGRAH